MAGRYHWSWSSLERSPHVSILAQLDGWALLAIYRQKRQVRYVSILAQLDGWALLDGHLIIDVGTDVSILAQLDGWALLS